MKKLSLLLLALAALITLKAQWVDDPYNNTFIANCNDGAAELYVSTDISTGDSYVQWHYQGENGWSPWIQRLNSEGVPQWPADGIHVTTPDFATWSPGYSMTAVEGGVVTMFRTLGPHHWVVKVNADGTFPWGEHGIMLFDGEGGGRSEVIAGDDGGVWVLGTDMDNSFLQYVNADGTLRTMATITDPDKKCTNGKLIASDDGVYVVYAKQTLQGYTNYIKEIYVAGYNKDGELIVPETLLLAQQTVGASYVHYAISDGMGGGYVYQWHSGIGGAYNIYVTHFDKTGTPTISEPNGVPVHSTDPNNFYINAYPTIDPNTNDLLLVYRQTEAYSQSQYKAYINRITTTGEKPWGEGILMLDNGTEHFYGLRIDAFENGDGFAVIYHDGASTQTIEAQGFDMDGNTTWSTQMCSHPYPKTGTENTTGFHEGQNIVAWVDAQNGGVYGQNIGWDGTMGEVTPPAPLPCDPPTDFQGTYFFETDTDFGVHLSWIAPQELPQFYHLYFTDPSSCTTIIEIDPTETEFIDHMSVIGEVVYQLTAVYEDCESEFALTPDGEDHITIEITSISENSEQEIVSILSVYNIKGQLINTKDINELTPGTYAIIGISESGKTIVKKVLK
jgi:hypothetical protein